MAEAFRGLEGGAAWGDLPAPELARRAAVMGEIVRRLEEAPGPHRARPCAERGRLFSPFAALRGLDEALEGAERDAEVE